MECEDYAGADSLLEQYRHHRARADEISEEIRELNNRFPRLLENLFDAVIARNEVRRKLDAAGIDVKEN